MALIGGLLLPRGESERLAPPPAAAAALASPLGGAIGGANGCGVAAAALAFGFAPLGAPSPLPALPLACGAGIAFTSAAGGAHLGGVLLSPFACLAPSGEALGELPLMAPLGGL